MRLTTLTEGFIYCRDMKEVITSGFLSVDARDWLKGLLFAGVSAALDPLLESFAAGKLTIDWKNVGTVALCAMIAYIKIKFFTKAKAVTQIEK